MQDANRFAACSGGAVSGRFPPGAVPIFCHIILTFRSGHLGTKQTSGAGSSCHRESVYRLMTLLRWKANGSGRDGRPIDWSPVTHCETICTSGMNPHANFNGTWDQFTGRKGCCGPIRLQIVDFHKAFFFQSLILSDIC